MIALSEVEAALNRSLGNRTALVRMISEAPWSVLNGYRQWQTSFEEMESRLEEVLFQTLYSVLGDSMTYNQSGSAPFRVPLTAIPDLTDRVMEVLFHSLPVSRINRDRLRDYVMDRGSPAAMRTLLELYPALMAPEETVLMRSILENRHEDFPGSLAFS